MLLCYKQEQIEWAVEEGADLIVAETFSNCDEALIGVKAAKEFGNGIMSNATLYDIIKIHVHTGSQVKSSR